MAGSSLWNYSRGAQDTSGIINGVTLVTDPEVTSESTGNMSDTADSENQEYREFYLRAQFITGLFCYPTVCLFGLTGNVLSIVVLSQRKMKSSTNTFLVALAISDGIKLINDSSYFLVILLLNVDPATGEKAYGYLYPYAHYFFNMSVCITAWLTVSVAAERYILVCHATKARQLCSIHRARLTSILVFVSMSLLTVPLALRYRTVHVFSNVTNTSTIKVEVTELWQNPKFVTAYTWIQNLLRSIVPLFILCTLNYFIVQALRRTRATRKRISGRHRITLMLISVIVVFLVCVTPDAVMSSFFRFGYYDANFLVRGVREITDLLLTVNSAANFVLYCTFNKVFRRQFLTLFCHHCCQEQLLRRGEEENGRRQSFATAGHVTTMNGSKREALVEHDYSQCQSTI